ncbi:MAG: SPASM domain-containing protein [Chitinophagaceae bacterium]|nr:SPASM domain-containing protein [Chitinophagaceae bacterium]
MYTFRDYIRRGFFFLNNQFFPRRKKLSTLMIYGTDLCDSACKHCLIWTKRPVHYLSYDKIVDIMKSRCITRNTRVGLEGGEFLLHPDALMIMKWFHQHHPNFDLLTNALRPELVMKAVTQFPPQRLLISLDGDKETYKNMRGKDGYDGIIEILKTLSGKIPISLMFTLSPYNDFEDLEHVAEVAQRWNTDLRIGVYNDISFFDTIESAHRFDIGSQKKEAVRNFSLAKQLIQNKPRENFLFQPQPDSSDEFIDIKSHLPKKIKHFPENEDYLILYDLWRRGKLRLRCHSIKDSLVILPNGDVPLCQNLDVKLGNVFEQTLDEIFNGQSSVKTQNYYCCNCNGCWINFHRKYDIILYRSLEKYLGKFLTKKLMGDYWWDSESRKSYQRIMKEYKSGCR